MLARLAALRLAVCDAYVPLLAAASSCILPSTWSRSGNGCRAAACAPPPLPPLLLHPVRCGSSSSCADDGDAPGTADGLARQAATMPIAALGEALFRLTSPPTAGGADGGAKRRRGYEGNGSGGSSSTSSSSAGHEALASFAACSALREQVAARLASLNSGGGASGGGAAPPAELVAGSGSGSGGGGGPALSRLAVALARLGKVDADWRRLAAALLPALVQAAAADARALSAGDAAWLLFGAARARRWRLHGQRSNGVGRTRHIRDGADGDVAAVLALADALGERLLRAAAHLGSGGGVDAGNGSGGDSGSGCGAARDDLLRRAELAMAAAALADLDVYAPRALDGMCAFLEAALRSPDGGGGRNVRAAACVLYACACVDHACPSLVAATAAHLRTATAAAAAADAADAATSPDAAAGAPDPPPRRRAARPPFALRHLSLAAWSAAALQPGSAELAAAAFGALALLPPQECARADPRALRQLLTAQWAAEHAAAAAAAAAAAGDSAAAAPQLPPALGARARAEWAASMRRWQRQEAEGGAPALDSSSDVGCHPAAAAGGGGGGGGAPALSATERAVAAALRRMGLEPQLGVVAPNGRAVVDILVGPAGCWGQEEQGL